MSIDVHEQSSLSHPTGDAVHRRVVIIGAGFTGLAVAMELRLRGVVDFVVLERGADVGGVWRDNTYPGVGVDTPSKLYQLRRVPNAAWSALFAPGSEVRDYTLRIAEEHGLRRHIRFHTAVEDVQWHPRDGIWRIRTTAQQFTADVVVSAAGLVADPNVPEIPGMHTFPGKTFHSSQWDHAHDLTGRRVAVIGTGASAIQFVPKIQPIVDELHVVQRTPAWIMPRQDIRFSEEHRQALAERPHRMRAEYWAMYLLTEILSTARRSKLVRGNRVRACRDHLKDQVPDPALRAVLTPDFDFLCKRPLISDDFLPALQQRNTTLHTGGLERVEGDFVFAGDGSRAKVDTIVFNTGFHIGATSPIAYRIRDAEGRSLMDHWHGRPHAYLGMLYPGFPNFFLMQGPNATSGVSSSLLFAEAQATYIADALVTLARRGINRVEVKEQVEERYTKRIRRMSARTVYEQGGCASYYLNDEGINVVMWPGLTAEYQWRTRRFDLESVHVEEGRSGAGLPLSVMATSPTEKLTYEPATSVTTVPTTDKAS